MRTWQREWRMLLLSLTIGLALSLTRPGAAQSSDDATKTLAVFPVTALAAAIQYTHYQSVSLSPRIVIVPELQQKLRSAIEEKSPNIKIVMPELDKALTQQILKSNDGSFDPKYALALGKKQAAQFVVTASLKLVAKNGTGDAASILSKIKDTSGSNGLSPFELIMHKGTYFVAEASGDVTEVATGTLVAHSEGAGVGKTTDDAYRFAVENLGKKLAGNLSEITKVAKVMDKTTPITLIIERRREATKVGDIYEIGNAEEVKSEGKIIYISLTRIALAKVIDVKPKAVILEVYSHDSPVKLSTRMSAHWLPHGDKPTKTAHNDTTPPTPAPHDDSNKTDTDENNPKPDTNENNPKPDNEKKPEDNKVTPTPDTNRPSIDKPTILSAGKTYESGTVWAVIVGVSYKNDDRSFIPEPLRCTINDANLMKKMLSTQTNRIRMVTDDGATPLQPTRDNVWNAVKEVAAKAGPNDQFWFYFSGHGDASNGGSYLIPCRVPFTNSSKLDDPKFMEENYVSVTAIRQWLQDNCKARAKVLILDACHSGSSRDIPKWQAGFDIKGMLTIAACQIDQTAQEFTDLGDGVFTYYLVLGLCGEAIPKDRQDNYVLSGDLEAYVNAQVRQECEKHHITPQSPAFIWPKESPEFVVAKRTESSGAKPASEALSKSLRKRYVENHEDNKPLDERKPLPPALIVALKNQEEAQHPNDDVPAQVKLILGKKGCPLANAAQARTILELVNKGADPNNEQERKDLAERAHRLLSRYLLLGSFHIEDIPSNDGAVHLTVTIEAELLDVNGNVLAPIDVHGDGIGNNRTQAINTAITHLNSDFMEQLLAGLKQNSPDALHQLNLEDKQPDNP